MKAFYCNGFASKRGFPIKIPMSNIDTYNYFKTSKIPYRKCFQVKMRYVQKEIMKNIEIISQIFYLSVNRPKHKVSGNQNCKHYC